MADLNPSSASLEARIVAFLRDATPLRRREWLANLTYEERAAVAVIVQRIAEDPWSQYRGDPVGFVERGLCETIWSKQREILESVRDNKRTAVPACHAPGKSHLAARIVAYWTMTNPLGTSQVVTTATTFRQVRNILWSHIRTLHSRHNLDGDCLTTEWKRDASVVAFGFAPAQYNETALQGIHAPNLLIVVDEAGGISDTIGNALEALMTGENTRLLLLGNPPTDTTNSWFERACRSNLYNTIRISAYDTPNFTGEPTGTCTTCPPTVKKHAIATHLVDKQWVDDIIHELGDNSPFAQARIHANFVENTTNRIIPASWIDEATRNTNPAHSNDIKLGVDIASDGGDEFVIARIDGYTARIIHTSSGDANANAVTVAQTILKHIHDAEATLHNNRYGHHEQWSPDHPQRSPHQHEQQVNTTQTPDEQQVNTRGGGSLLGRAKGGLPGMVSVKVDAIGLGWGVVVAMLVHAWVDFNFHIPATAISCFLLLGLATAVTWPERPSRLAGWINP
ncbi:MAG: hypothetical protein EBT82_05480, partial [Micrococcales bacterium]|nr:hypothetical protein [Micrococcales bacterium]